MIRQLSRKILSKLRGDLTVDKLIDSGLILGKNVQIKKDVIIDPSHCWLIEICDDVVIAPRAIILAHDASSIHGKATRIGNVKIGKKTFVGAGAIILPGVKVGENVVIGAGSVVTKDIPDNAIVVGNPCNIIGNRLESEQRHQNNLTLKPIYPWPEFGIEGGITNEQKNKMKNDLKDTSGYLVNDLT
jgi:maltose O-acetyltransferase